MACLFPSGSHSDTVTPSPITSGNPNLTTCLYHTDLGIISLTWSKTIFGRALHIDLHFQEHEQDLFSSSFRLHLKPFLFWRKHGVKKFHSSNSQSVVQLYWDLSRAKFSSIPEPQSSFYVALVVDGEMILVVGDLSREAYERTKATKMVETQSLISRKEHVTGNKAITTRASIGGKVRDISIDCSVGGDHPKLSFSVDSQNVLVVKRLKWKFRGNEKIEVDGVLIQVSWDVYNWFFDDGNDGHACFMFRFEETDEFEQVEPELNAKKSTEVNGYFGMNGFEKKNKLRGNSFMTTTSSSSSSVSSASSLSGSSSSIMEWARLEEDELESQFGFSLLVYAWRS